MGIWVLAGLVVALGVHVQRGHRAREQLVSPTWFCCPVQYWAVAKSQDREDGCRPTRAHAVGGLESGECPLVSTVIYSGQRVKSYT
jgi:hypothetical protein